MMTARCHTDERGGVLLGVMLLTMLLTAISVTMSLSGQTELLIARRDESAAQAHAAAEAGLNHALDVTLTRLPLMAAALQNRIDGLWAEFTARDNPLQRIEIEQNRNDAIQELQRTEAEVGRLDQEIRNIQDEARRSRVPPGWLR